MERNPIPYGGTCPACRASAEILVVPGQPERPIPRLLVDCLDCGAVVELGPIAP